MVEPRLEFHFAYKHKHIIGSTLSYLGSYCYKILEKIGVLKCFNLNAFKFLKHDKYLIKHSAFTVMLKPFEILSINNLVFMQTNTFQVTMIQNMLKENTFLTNPSTIPKL